MRHLSLFSGIGGLDLAAEWAGMETVGFVEIDPFCQKVLNKHWPGVKIYDDIRTVTRARLESDGIGAVDIISGGFPCQPFSAAGKRKGKDDDRDLWPEMFRVIQEIRPAWVIGENVAGFVNMELERTLTDLENEGYETQAFIIPACAVGAPHERKRVFIVAYSNSNFRDKRRPESERQQRQARVANGGGNVAYPKSGGRRPGLCEGEPAEERRRRPSNGSCPDNTAERCGSNVPNTHDGRGAVRRDGGLSTASQTEGCRDDNRGGAAQYVPGEWWAVEPDVGRVAHGVSRRVDKLKCLGNAVVPQQAYPIYKAIMDIERGVIS